MNKSMRLTSTQVSLTGLTLDTSSQAQKSTHHVTPSINIYKMNHTGLEC